MQGRRLVEWAHRHPLAYVVGGYCLWLLAWEVTARLDRPSETPLEQLAATGFPLATDAVSPVERDNLPRLLVLGNSQIHSVRDTEDRCTYGFPAQLRNALHERELEVRIADLSAGGQQVTESLALLLDSFDAVRPDHVVLGVGLINLHPEEIRPELVRSCEWQRIRARAAECVPPEVPAETRTRMMQLLVPEGTAVEPSEPTVQERLDERLYAWFRACSVAVRNRERTYDRLIHRPIQKDLQNLFRRDVRTGPLATTFKEGPDHEAALAALRTMGAFCRRRGVPLTVLVMPFDAQGEPRPYASEDEDRLRGTLGALAAAGEFQLHDLSRALGPEHFGRYSDGSPDGFHFKASGHAVLGDVVAGRLRPQLGAVRLSGWAGHSERR